MEKAIDSNLPRTRKFIQVGPAQLRMIADKLELASKNALPGQEIDYEVTKEIVFMYNPEVPLFGAQADTLRSGTVPPGGLEYQTERTPAQATHRSLDS